MSLLWILVALLILAALFGGWTHAGPGRPDWGYYGWSPAGLVLLILVVLWLTGNLHV